MGALFALFASLVIAWGHPVGGELLARGETFRLVLQVWNGTYFDNDALSSVVAKVAAAGNDTGPFCHEDRNPPCPDVIQRLTATVRSEERNFTARAARSMDLPVPDGTDSEANVTVPVLNVSETFLYPWTTGRRLLVREVCGTLVPGSPHVSSSYMGVPGGRWENAFGTVLPLVLEDGRKRGGSFLVTAEEGACRRGNLCDYGDRKMTRLLFNPSRWLTAAEVTLTYQVLDGYGPPPAKLAGYYGYDRNPDFTAPVALEYEVGLREQDVQALEVEFVLDAAEAGGGLYVDGKGLGRGKLNDEVRQAWREPGGGARVVFKATEKELDPNLRGRPVRAKDTHAFRVVFNNTAGRQLSRAEGAWRFALSPPNVWCGSGPCGGAPEGVCLEQNKGAVIAAAVVLCLWMWVTYGVVLVDNHVANRGKCGLCKGYGWVAKDEGAVKFKIAHLVPPTVQSIPPMERQVAALDMDTKFNICPRCNGTQVRDTSGGQEGGEAEIPRWMVYCCPVGVLLYTRGGFRGDRAAICFWLAPGVCIVLPLLASTCRFCFRVCCFCLDPLWMLLSSACCPWLCGSQVEDEVEELYARKKAEEGRAGKTMRRPSGPDLDGGHADDVEAPTPRQQSCAPSSSGASSARPPGKGAEMGSTPGGSSGLQTPLTPDEIGQMPALHKYQTRKVLKLAVDKPPLEPAAPLRSKFLAIPVVGEE